MNSGHETLLVVEDDEGVLALTSLVLANAGYRVLEAHNRQEAVAVSERHKGPIDLVVVDLMLPDGSGRDVAQQIEAARPRVRVLFVTGYGQDMLPTWVAAPAEDVLLEKPFTAQTLLARVRAALDAATH